MRIIGRTISAAACAMVLLLVGGATCIADRLPLRIVEGSSEILMRRRPLEGSIEIHALFPQGTKVRLANSPRSQSVILEIKISTPKKKRKPRKLPVEEGGILRSVGIAPGPSTIEITFELASISIPKYTWWRTKSGLTIVLPPLDEGDEGGILDYEPADAADQPSPEPEPPMEETPTVSIDEEVRRILERVEDGDDTSFSAVDYWREHAGTARELSREPEEPTPAPLDAGEKEGTADRPVDEPPSTSAIESIEFAKLSGGKVGILKIGLDRRPRFALERLSDTAYRVLVPGTSLAKGAEQLRKAPKGFKGLRSARAKASEGSVEITVNVSRGTRITASPVGSEIWIGVAR